MRGSTDQNATAYTNIALITIYIESDSKIRLKHV